MFADDLQPMPDQGALYLAPSGILVDQRSYIAPLDRFLSADNPVNSETVVRDIIEALDSAGSDDRISHLILDTSYLEGAGIAKLEEISTALLNFKQSNKPKKSEYIDSWLLQTSAYSLAHNIVYNSNITSCVILVCTVDKLFQEFKIQSHDLVVYQNLFLGRLKKFNELSNLA